MNIKIGVKRRFIINGKEYKPIGEIPHNIQGAREILRKLMDSQVGSGHRISSALTPTKIIFNGTEYETIESMPQDVREAYERVLKAVEIEASSSGVDIAKTNGGMLAKPGTNCTTHPREFWKPTKGEFSSFPRRSIASSLLFALFLLLYYLLQKG